MTVTNYKRAVAVLFSLLSCLLACTVVGCLQERESTQDNDVSFLVRRSSFKTKLHSPGPSPQSWRREEPPQGIREVIYPSGDLQLKAWVHVPNLEEAKKHPALVFFHGGFAFGASDLHDCQPFIDAGFVVMTPWLRGENGLPGNFETFYGELDDAVAAVRWLSNEPYVDAEQIYTFGHSSGGVLSAMLSLMDDIPIQHGGSSGGLYGTDIFDFIGKERVAFDLTNPTERELRVLPGNIRWMKRPHYAYIGRSDDGVMGGVRAARREIADGDGQLEIIMIHGDHSSSYSTAMRKYLEFIESHP